MLTLLTEFRAFRVSRSSLVATLGRPVTTKRIVKMNYAAVVELLALLNGEQVSFVLMVKAILVLCEVWIGEAEALVHSLPNVTEERFSFTGQEGVTTIEVSKSTLARHFTLVRDYIEEYPDATSISIPDCTHILATISGILELNVILSALRWAEEASVYTLQILNPVSELYYFFLPLSLYSTQKLIDLCNSVTDDERRWVLEAHRTLRASPSAPELLDYIPEGGAGPCILAAFNNGRTYLCEKGSALLPHHPSYLFMNAYLHDRCGSDELMDTLLDGTFDDETCYLSDEDVLHVVQALTYSIVDASEEKIGKILAMMGVRHPSFGNIELQVSAPFQIEILPHSLKREHIEAIIQNVCRYAAPAPSGHLGTLLSDYLQKDDVVYTDSDDE